MRALKGGVGACAEGHPVELWLWVHSGRDSYFGDLAGTGERADSRSLWRNLPLTGHLPDPSLSMGQCSPLIPSGIGSLRNR